MTGLKVRDVETTRLVSDGRGWLRLAASGRGSRSSSEHFVEVRKMLAVMAEVNLEVVENGDLAERVVAPRPREPFRR